MRPWKRISATFAVLVVSAYGWGQAGESMSFENLDIAAGVVKFNIDTGRIDRIGEGATLVVHPTDPAEKDLRIRAGEITMRYATEEGSDPSQIIFDGKVNIEHPVGTITAGHAEWDFLSNVIVFTEKPAIQSEFAKQASAERITLDLANSTMELYGDSQMQGVDLMGRGGGGSSDPSLFSASDVRDWPGLISKLKAGSAAEAPSPAKQVIGTLDAQSKKTFQGASETMLLENKAQVVKMLNNAVKSAKLYSAEAWAGVDLDDATKGLVAEAPQSGEALTKMNRALLHAAFPSELAE